MTDCTQFPKRVRRGKWIQEYKPSAQDGLCPGFWKGAPAAFGCPFSCEYCFLARPRALHTGSRSGCVLYPLYDNEVHEVSAANLRRLNDECMKLYPCEDDVWDTKPPDEYVAPPSINWGESADSLACESQTGFLLGWLMEWAQDSNIDFPVHLLLTKSAGEGWLDQVLRWEPTDKLIFSFSVTTEGIERRYEERTPTVIERLDAAATLSHSGWRVRLRIDPLAAVSAAHAEAEIMDLIDWALAGHLCVPRTAGASGKRLMRSGYMDGVKPELITLGTLRFTGCNAYSKPLIEQFGMGRDAGGRYRLPMEQRVELYKAAVEAIGGRCVVGLCKEPVETHVAVFGDAPDAKAMRCNCTA